MRSIGILCLLAVITFSLPAFAQVSTKTGSIYGKTIDDKGAPLPGVSITLESDVLTQTSAMSGSRWFSFCSSTSWNLLGELFDGRFYRSTPGRSSC